MDDAGSVMAWYPSEYRCMLVADSLEELVQRWQAGAVVL